MASTVMRPKAGAGPGRSERRNVNTVFPLARQRESSSCPHVPCERRTGPAERPSPNTSSGAGPGRSERRNVNTVFPLARQRESPTYPHVPCERRTGPAERPACLQRLHSYGRHT